MLKSCLPTLALPFLLSTLAFPSLARAASVLPPPKDQELARDMFKTLIEINTTHAHGSTAAAKAIEAWMLAAGFAPEDVKFIAPAEHPTPLWRASRARARYCPWFIWAAPGKTKPPDWRWIAMATAT